jgi:hypothetical protein
VAPSTRTEAVLLRAALQPSLAEGLSVAHVLLRALGYVDLHADAVFTEAIAAEGARRPELPPYGVLEKLWIRELWDQPQDQAAWDDALGKSCLASSPDAVGGIREDAYAFTHALMYVTDFGAQRRPLPRSGSDLTADATALLAVSIERADYDLAGEVLMTWPLVGEPWSPAALFALAVLARAEDSAGLLPGGTTDPDRLRALSGAERRDYALGTAYHTAFVMGMLCAVALRPGREPGRASLPSTVAAPSCVPPFAQVDRPEIASSITGLSGSELAGVWPFLVDLEIAGAIRSRTYAHLADVLRGAHASDMPRSVLFAQALRLLARLAHLARDNRSGEAPPDTPAVGHPRRGRPVISPEHEIARSRPR